MNMSTCTSWTTAPSHMALSDYVFADCVCLYVFVCPFMSANGCKLDGYNDKVCVCVFAWWIGGDDDDSVFVLMNFSWDGLLWWQS